MFNQSFNGFSEIPKDLKPSNFSWQSVPNSTPLVLHKPIVPVPDKIPTFKPEPLHKLFDSDPLKKFNERLESLEKSIESKQHQVVPIVQNFYTSDKTNTKIKTHASTFERKSIDPTKTLPSYIVNGNVYCDNCKLGELLHGYHLCSDDYPVGSELCAKCFNLLKDSLVREHWVGFSISIQDNQ